MKYDFTSVPDRSKSGSSKWNAAPGACVEQVPLSTADMEFVTAPEIVEELVDLAQHEILGYTNPTERYYSAVCGWMKRRHDFDVQPEWIVTTPGVVYALGMLIDAVTEPGDSVMIMSPVYYPFDLTVLARERNIVYNPLKLEGTTYRIDYDDLAQKAARPECRALMFCSPHNPVGRVWTPEELAKVVDICVQNDVFIISDEIHFDLIMPGYKHTVLANVSEKAKDICAICTAPSKTFNLAGLQCSNIIIPNETVRKKAMAMHLLNLMTHLNIFAYRACEAAYNRGEAWLDEAVAVIRQNADYIRGFMAEHFPEVTVFPLEGTYLLWLDMRPLGMTHKELEAMMKEEAGLYLDEGHMFGPAGRGFERINIACSPLTVERSMQRFKTAMEKKRAQWAREGKPYRTTLQAGQKLERFVYDTPAAAGLALEKTIEKPTLIVFSRYFTCSICQMMLVQLRQLWPRMQQLGWDLKVVLQSTRESVAKATRGNPFPFDLICDPDAELYERYNVFEADSMAGFVAGDKNIDSLTGGDLKKFVVDTFVGGAEPTEGRQLQLPAVFAVAPDMTVTYAHYAATVTDLPDFQNMLMRAGESHAAN